MQASGRRGGPAARVRVVAGPAVSAGVAPPEGELAPAAGLGGVGAGPAQRLGAALAAAARGGGLAPAPARRCRSVTESVSCSNHGGPGVNRTATEPGPRPTRPVNLTFPGADDSENIRPAGPGRGPT